MLSLALATGVSVNAIYAAEGQTGSNKSTDQYTRALQQQFNMKDLNKDGKVTWKEFKGSETNAYRLLKLERIFKAMDTNHTGYVTFEQFKTYWRNFKAHKKAAKTTTNKPTNNGTTGNNGTTTTNGITTTTATTTSKAVTNGKPTTTSPTKTATR
jgi:hypothetical protein